MHTFHIQIKNLRCFANAPAPKRIPLKGVGKVVLVASGKGGVGKSTVAGAQLSDVVLT